MNGNNKQVVKMSLEQDQGIFRSQNLEFISGRQTDTLLLCLPSICAKVLLDFRPHRYNLWCRTKEQYLEVSWKKTTDLGLYEIKSNCKSLHDILGTDFSTRGNQICRTTISSSYVSKPTFLFSIGILRIQRQTYSAYIHDARNENVKWNAH